MSLNPPQRAAVEHSEGPLLVLAGAGSGKTRVIAEKIAHLVTRRGVAARKIAAITFTNKAAREMRSRVARLLPGAAGEELQLCTFHALGLRFLQIEHARAGLRRGFSVLDSDDSGAVFKDLLPKGCKNDVVEALRQLVSRAKSAGLTPDAAAQSARSAREHEAAETYAAYQQRLAAFNAVDFDDLIRLPVGLLQADGELAAAWRERIRYLLVDEYQDTNAAQYQLFTLLVGPRGDFTAVGDDDQSIYGWRGADPGNLDQLGRDYPKLKVIKLEQNYRCTRRILRAANAVIANNPHLHPKALWSGLAEGAPLRVLECRNDEEEAGSVAADIANRQQTSQAPWSEFALLYRGNHQSRALEKALRLLNVPYHLTGGTAFFERAEVKDLLAYLRLIANPDDDAAFLRAVNTPRRDIGSISLEKLGQLAQTQKLSLLSTAASTSAHKHMSARPASALAGFAEIIRNLRGEKLPPAELCERLLTTIGYLAHLRSECKDPAALQRRKDNIDELVAWFRSASKGGENSAELAAQLALLSHADRDDGGNAVRLMTLHSAKGLEFRFVYLVGVEEGVLPHDGSLAEGRLEEERRLLYVGITRAKEALTLSFAARKRRYGEIVAVEPSRFLAELPSADLHWSGRDPALDQAQKSATASAHLGRLANLFSD